jgi:hypothetical protein
MDPASGSIIKQLLMDYRKNGGGEIRLSSYSLHRVKYTLHPPELPALLQKLATQLAVFIGADYFEVL